MSLLLQISQDLRIPRDYISLVAKTASYRYKDFRIRKRSGRGTRRVQQPTREVKLLQRWLVAHVFARLPVHEAAHGYVKGRSIVTNAKTHKRARYISRFDIRDFFPSLTADDVALLLRRNRKRLAKSIRGDADVLLVTSIVCRNGSVPIGAPSSPAISNALMYRLDAALSSLVRREGAAYTRYADDLYFSATKPDILPTVCKKATRLIQECDSPHLSLNKKKTFHTSRKRRMPVTGIRVTPESKLSVGRELKRKVRTFAYLESKNRLSAKDSLWLRGMLSFVRSVEPKYVEVIQRRYGPILSG